MYMYVPVFSQLEEKEKNNKEEIEKLRKQLADLEEKFLEVLKRILFLQSSEFFVHFIEVNFIIC